MKLTSICSTGILDYLTVSALLCISIIIIITFPFLEYILLKVFQICAAVRMASNILLIDKYMNANNHATITELVVYQTFHSGLILSTCLTQPSSK
jgi:hypothetical protein